MLIASLGFSQLGDSIARADLPKEAAMVVPDSEDVVLARTIDPDNRVGKNVREAPLVQAILKAGRVGITVIEGFDGVTEAFSKDEGLFGNERLLGQLAEEPVQNPCETVSSILRALRNHASGAPQSDDISIVAVRFSPHGHMPLPRASDQRPPAQGLEMVRTGGLAVVPVSAKVKSVSRNPMPRLACRSRSSTQNQRPL